MQIMVGRIWSNGKMFSVAGKKDLLSSLAIAMTIRPKLRAQSQHIDIVFNFLRQNLCSAKIVLHLMLTANITA